MESVHLRRRVFDNDSKLTYEIVDHYVEKMIVNGTEGINIEWRAGGSRHDKDVLKTLMEKRKGVHYNL